MTRSQLVARTRRWQRLLGLDLWEITVEFREEPGDYWAAASPSKQYRTAELAYDPGLHTRPEVQVDAVIVHELLHVLMRDADESVEAAVSQLLPQAGEQAAKRYAHAVEGFVDALALSITKLATTPPARPGKRAARTPRVPRRSA